MVTGIIKNKKKANRKFAFAPKSTINVTYLCYGDANI